MTRLEREELRLLDEARRVVAERVDPDDTMTVWEAITGHEAEVEAEYRTLLATDPVIRAMAS